MQRRHFTRLIATLPAALFAGRATPTQATLLIQESPIAGFQYHHGEQLWLQLAIGQPLTLIREPDNRYDPRAVRVDWQGQTLGYLPRAENVAVAQMMDRGYHLSANITALQQSRNPWQRATLCITSMS